MKKFAQELRDFADLIENVEVDAYAQEVNVAVSNHEDWTKLREAVKDYPGMFFNTKTYNHSCEMTTGRSWDVPVSFRIFHVYGCGGTEAACLNAHMGA